MQWGSLEQFLAMGGYGFYVWGSYVVCAGVVGAEILALRQRRRSALAEARRVASTAGRPA